MSGKSALVFGASGLIGGEVVRRLLERPEYQRVTLLLRRHLDMSHPKLEQNLVDFAELDRYESFGVDDVFCCLGTTMGKAKSRAAFKLVDLHYPLAIARLAKEIGADKFLVVSATGAKRTSRFFYNRVKGELEEAVLDLGLNSAHIFRPSLLLGNRQEIRFGERIATLVLKVAAPCLVGPLGKYKPIEAREVASAMVRVAQQVGTGTHVYESDEIADLAGR